MTEKEITDLITQAIDEVAPGKSDKFDPNNLKTSIREAGIDSVASMEMMAAIEEEIGVNFPDDELASVQSFADLVTMMKKAS